MSSYFGYPSWLWQDFFSDCLNPCFAWLSVCWNFFCVGLFLEDKCCIGNFGKLFQVLGILLYVILNLSPRVFRLWEELVFLQLSQLNRPCLVPALPLDLLFLRILLCIPIPNLLFLWVTSPTWLAILSCLRVTHTCHQVFSKHLLAIAHTISLWQQQCSLNIKIVFLWAACLSLLQLPLAMGLGTLPAFLEEIFLWIHPLLLQAQPWVTMMF